MRSTFLYTLAFLLTVIGAINWGLIGLFGFNLVKRALGRFRTAEKAVYSAVGIAGMLLGLAVAIPWALVALGVRSSPRVQRGRSIVGQALPTISGANLNGEAITLPRDALGKIALVVTGFSYESRFDVEDWVEAFVERFGGRPQVDHFVVPMIGGVYRLFAPMIDEGMRRGSPPESYDHTVTVYGQVATLREALGASSPTEVWVYLVDKDGKVMLQYGGPFDESRFDELSSKVESALTQTRTGRRQRAA